MVDSSFEPVRRPVTLEDRVAALELVTGLAELPAAPAPAVRPDPVAKAATLVGGVRIVSTPAEPVTAGERVPSAGVTVSVIDGGGTAHSIRLLVGQVFEPGPVADQIEATAARVHGLEVERIGGDA